MRALVSAHQWRPIPIPHCPPSSSSPPYQLPVSSFALVSLSSEAPPFPRVRIRCSSARTPGSGSGENESKAVLDAFFLGKAFAEALNERIGSTVGEILSVVGQWQAEQQKQVQDFQEEVLERAKRAKERAALEVTEQKGDVSKSFSERRDDGVGSAVLPPTPNRRSPASDPFQGMFKD
ncbi:putative plastoglobular protein [Dioscorea sansibarensis]